VATREAGEQLAQPHPLMAVAGRLAGRSTRLVTGSKPTPRRRSAKAPSMRWACRGNQTASSCASRRSASGWPARPSDEAGLAHPRVFLREMPVGVGDQRRPGIGQPVVARVGAESGGNWLAIQATRARRTSFLGAQALAR